MEKPRNANEQARTQEGVGIPANIARTAEYIVNVFKWAVDNILHDAVPKKIIALGLTQDLYETFKKERQKKAIEILDRDGSSFFAEHEYSCALFKAHEELLQEKHDDSVFSKQEIQNFLNKRLICSIVTLEAHTDF